MSYKIVVKGGYGLTNFGDDALMHILAIRFKPFFNAEEIAFACYENKYNKKISNGYIIESVHDFEFLKTKILLFGGGTQFYSFSTKRSISRIFLSKLKTYILNPPIITNKLTKRKNIGYKYITAMGIGVGPFFKNADPAAEINARKMLQTMSYLAIRDTYSMQKTQEWHIKNANLYADLCYLHDTTKYIIQKKKKINSIGIVVRDWDHTFEGNAYYNKIEIITKKLEAQGFVVTLIIFATKSDKFWNKKKKTFSKVLEWNPSNETIDQFINKLSLFDLFLTARYHGAVFASLLDIPFISIVVEQKLELISDVFKNGSEKWKHPFDINNCLQLIHKIDKNYSKYLENIHEETIEQQQKAELMFKEFISYCKSKNIVNS